MMFPFNFSANMKHNHGACTFDLNNWIYGLSVHSMTLMLAFMTLIVGYDLTVCSMTSLHACIYNLGTCNETLVLALNYHHDNWMYTLTVCNMTMVHTFTTFTLGCIASVLAS